MFVVSLITLWLEMPSLLQLLEPFSHLAQQRIVMEADYKSKSEAVLNDKVGIPASDFNLLPPKPG
jgi:hypothetical protein